MSYANNKGTDQPAHLHTLISAFVVHRLDSIIHLVAISVISSIYQASVAVQTGLSLTWSKTLKTGFLVTRRNLSSNIHFYASLVTCFALTINFPFSQGPLPARPGPLRVPDVYIQLVLRFGCYSYCGVCLQIHWIQRVGTSPLHEEILIRWRTKDFFWVHVFGCIFSEIFIFWLTAAKTLFHLLLLLMQDCLNVVIHKLNRPLKHPVQKQWLCLKSKFLILIKICLWKPKELEHLSTPASLPWGTMREVDRKDFTLHSDFHEYFCSA